MYIKDGNKNRYPERNTEALCENVGKNIGKLKPNSSGIRTRVSKAAKRASRSTQVTKERFWNMWTHCWMRPRICWHRTGKRQEVLNSIFTSVSTGKTALQESLVTKNGESLEGRCVLGGSGSGQGILDQMGYTYLWDLTGFTHDSRESWLMSLRGYSWSSWIIPGE